MSGNPPSGKSVPAGKSFTQSSLPELLWRGEPDLLAILERILGDGT